MLTAPLSLSTEAGASKRIPGFAPWNSLIRRLFRTWGRQDRLPRELTALSDHILLDIGIDPRHVPNRAGEITPRPELEGLVPPFWRPTARS